jgi:hypothetical protein
VIGFVAVSIFPFEGVLSTVLWPVFTEDRKRRHLVWYEGCYKHLDIVGNFNGSSVTTLRLKRPVLQFVVFPPFALVSAVVLSRVAMLDDECLDVNRLSMSAICSVAT